MFCSNCGNKCNEDAKFCSKCGAPLVPSEEKSKAPQTSSKKGKAAVIALSVVSMVLLTAVIFTYLIFFTDIFKKKAVEFDEASIQKNTDIEADTEEYAEADVDKEGLYEEAENSKEEEAENPKDADVLLEEKIQELSLIDLNGLSYEHHLSDYVYQCDGLAATKGDIKVYTLDLDADGQYELLNFSLDYNEREGTHFIKLEVYEAEGDQVIKADSAIAVSCIFNSTFDAGDVQFFIKDGKYLCIVDEAACMLEADGVSVNMNIYSYNGKSIEYYASCGYIGSDWQDAGVEQKEFCDLCKKIGLDKTAYLLYNTDHFYFSVADAGLEPMFKLRAELDGEYNAPVISTRISLLDAAAGDWIFADSSVRLLSESELEGLTKEECRIARNEIYARNAWRFEDEGLAEFFSQKAWYRAAFGPDNITDNDLNETERSNIRLIKAAEAEK